MNFRRLGLVTLAVLLGMGMVRPASAQVSAYVDFSASKLTGGIANPVTSVLYGPTVGMTAQLTSKKHFKLAADLRANLYGGKQRLDGVAVGPKFAFPLRKFEGYGEFLVGFARYNDGLGNKGSSSTDSQIELNFGVDRRVSNRFDWRVVEFGYMQYYGLGGEFNPKTFSTGIVYRFASK